MDVKDWKKLYQISKERINKEGLYYEQQKDRNKEAIIKRKHPAFDVMERAAKMIIQIEKHEQQKEEEKEDWLQN